MRTRESVDAYAAFGGVATGAAAWCLLRQSVATRYAVSVSGTCVELITCAWQSSRTSKLCRARCSTSSQRTPFVDRQSVNEISEPMHDVGAMGMPADSRKSLRKSFDC